jgi:chromosome segregation ATPase
MTIDERLQAIAMHLEVLNGMHQDLEKRHVELHEEHNSYQRQMADCVVALTALAGRLTQIVEDHEKRLDRLEGREGKSDRV